MIKTNQKKSRLDTLKSILVVAPYTSNEQVKSCIKTYKSTFPSHIAIQFLFVVDKLKKEHVFFEDKSVNYISNKDFSLFGKIKPSHLKELLNEEYDAMLCSCFEFNKYVKKTLEKTKNKLSIGIDQKEFNNFDIGFVIEDKSENRLAHQTIKYLKQL